MNMNCGSCGARYTNGIDKQEVACGCWRDATTVVATTGTTTATAATTTATTTTTTSALVHSHGRSSRRWNGGVGRSALARKRDECLSDATATAAAAVVVTATAARMWGEAAEVPSDMWREGCTSSRDGTWLDTEELRVGADVDVEAECALGCLECRDGDGEVGTEYKSEGGGVIGTRDECGNDEHDADCHVEGEGADGGTGDAEDVEDGGEEEEEEHDLDARSVDARSVDARSVDARSVDTRSVDTRSVDTRSVDMRSVDTRSMDMRSLSMDTRSMDARSIEASAAQSETASTVSRAALSSLCERADFDPRDSNAILAAAVEARVLRQVEGGSGGRGHDGVARAGQQGQAWRSEKHGGNKKRAQLRSSFVRELLLSSLSM